MQAYSRPYFLEQMNTQSYGVKVDVLQANLGYARIGRDRSITVRVGQLTSAFGSFLLRYDDAANPLIGMPLTYGYYYKPVTSLGMPGAQVDATWKRLDGRVQFASSSPANRRGLFDSDQYGTWTAGAGYTILQGLRVGASTYRGPYLHRQHRFFRPNETNPNRLPATAYGVDVQVGHGMWNLEGEYQHFLLTYRAGPNVRQHAAYSELRRTLSPRWYLAVRAGYQQMSTTGRRQLYETAAGFRVNERQLVKLGWALEHPPGLTSRTTHTLGVQFVATLPALSISRD